MSESKPIEYNADTPMKKLALSLFQIPKEEVKQLGTFFKNLNNTLKEKE